MAYLDVITLAEAKTYLRIDDTLTKDDANITRMIISALTYVEKITNHIMYAQDKEFRFINGCVRVYDYPINNLITPTDAVEYPFTLYSNYQNTSVDNTILTLNVGYADPLTVPQELREVAFEIIDIYYYGKETNKTMADLSPLAMQDLVNNKRFIL
jgi:hypothetical protein